MKKNSEVTQFHIQPPILSSSWWSTVSKETSSLIRPNFQAKPFYSNKLSKWLLRLWKGSDAFMRKISFTEISSHKTFCWKRFTRTKTPTTLGIKLQILVSPGQSVVLELKHIVAPKNIWLLKSSATPIMVYPLIFGLWASCFISCCSLNTHLRAMIWRLKLIEDAVIHTSVFKQQSQKSKS